MKKDLESLGMRVQLRGRCSRWSASQWVRIPALATLLMLLLGGGFDPEPGPILLDQLGSWPGFGRGPAADVAVANHHAFVAIEEGGLLVLDVTDPSKPIRVASYALPGQAQFVRVRGSRAYVATRVVRGGGGCTFERWRGRLAILDVSDPTNPALLGNYTTSREIQCLFAGDDRVYLGDSVDGLHIVDVSDPARPRALSVGKPEDCQSLRALWASGPRLYCLMYDRCDVVDISRPTSPKVVISLYSELGLTLRGICGSDDFVFLAEGDFGFSGEPDRGGLSVFNSNPAGELILRGKLAMQNAALNVTIEGTTGYVTAGPAGIVAVDFSNPAQPVPKGITDTPGMALSLEVVGSNAYVADYHGGLQIIDVQNPSQISSVSAFDTGLTTRRLKVDADKAYLISSDTHPAFLGGYEAKSRLEIVDVKNPARPALLATYELSSLIVCLDTSGNLVYLGCNEFDRGSGVQGQIMQILDVTVPAKPVWVSDTQVGTSAANLALRLSDQHAFVASGSDTGFQIFDISNPVNPFLLGQTNSGFPYEEVRVMGSHAYLGHDSGLDVFDIANPRNPQPAGSVSFEYSSQDDCDT